MKKLHSLVSKFLKSLSSNPSTSDTKKLRKAVHVVSYFYPRNDASMALICVNWSMTCWSTEEFPETAVGLVTYGVCNVVSVDRVLISILSMSVEALNMLCPEAVEALAPRIWDLKLHNLPSPLRLMCNLRK